MCNNVEVSSKISFLLILLTLALSGALVLQSTHTSATEVEYTSVIAVAEHIYSECSIAPYRPTCYERSVNNFLGQLQPLEAMDVIRHLRSLDDEYIYCHTAAHIVGEYAVGIDPDNWLDVVASGPSDNMCSFGFEHGAVLGKFNSEYLAGEAFDQAVSELAFACEDRANFFPSELQRAMCYHGIGHVLVHISGAQIESALAGCNTLARKPDGRDYTRVCYEGVFMQLFQPLEPEDYALINRLEMEPSPENIVAFCNKYAASPDMYGVCWREAWPLVLQGEWGMSELVQHCQLLSSEDEQYYCFNTGFTIHARHTLGNDAVSINFCSAAPKFYQGMCMTIAAMAYIEEDVQLFDAALTFCQSTDSESLRADCLSGLASVIEFMFRDPVSHQVHCQKIPEQYRDGCKL